MAKPVMIIRQPAIRTGFINAFCFMVSVALGIALMPSARVFGKMRGLAVGIRMVISVVL